MQATQSDTDSKESVSIASEDARYDPNDMLAFVASMESMNDIDCDCDSDDDEFTYDKVLKSLVILLLSMKD